MANLDQYGQPLRDPAAAILQRKYALAQALQKQGMDTSPLVGTGKNGMQALARVLQAGIGTYLGSRAEGEAAEMSARQQAERERALAQAQALYAGAPPSAAAPMPAAPTDAAPPMTERLGGAPPVDPPAPVPQVEQQPLGPPSGPTPPPGMYGRNAPAVAQRDAMLAAPPQVLADASAATAQTRSGLPTNVAYREPAAGRSEGGAWTAGLPPATGAVPALAPASPGPAPQAAPAAMPQQDPADMRRRAALLRGMNVPQGQAMAAALESQAAAVEMRAFRSEDTAETRRIQAEARAAAERRAAIDDARASEQLQLQRDAARRAEEAATRAEGRAGLPSGFRPGPNGTAERIPGLPPPADPASQPTEGERKASGYLQRMEGAEAMMQRLTRPRTDPSPGEGYDPSNLRDRAASYIPLAGNFLTTERGQRYMTAASEWARAKLRHESGAVISDSEAASEARQYFAMPGDSAERIAQKEALRATAVEGLRTAAGRAATAPAAPAAPPQSGNPSAQGGAHPPLPPGFRVVR